MRFTVPRSMAVLRVANNWISYRRSGVGENSHLPFGQMPGLTKSVATAGAVFISVNQFARPPIPPYRDPAWASNIEFAQSANGVAPTCNARNRRRKRPDRKVQRRRGSRLRLLNNRTAGVAGLLQNRLASWRRFGI